MRNKGGQEGGNVIVSDCGERGYLLFEHACSFRLAFLFLFPLVAAKLIGEYFDIELNGANCSVRQNICALQIRQTC
jgi:hypothetical protein